jgi:tRNA1(Val) A37 N6-methylase TrmN6
MADLLYSDSLTDDAFLGGALRLLQPAEGFRSGLDAVLLAAAIPAAPGETALEAGAGAGAASLSLARRVPGLRVTGLEIDPALAALANQNAARNGLADFVSFETGSVAAAPKTIGRYGHVFANPPFLEAGEALTGEHPGRSRAKHGEAKNGKDENGKDGVLSQFVGFCIRHAEPKGSVTLIHRADRLDRILAAIDGRLGALAILPLWPRAGSPAKRVIVLGRKSSRAPLTLLPGLVLHEADGAFTAEADAILRHGAPLFSLKDRS